MKQWESRIAWSPTAVGEFGSTLRRFHRWTKSSVFQNRITEQNCVRAGTIERKAWWRVTLYTQRIYHIHSKRDKESSYYESHKFAMFLPPGLNGFRGRAKIGDKYDGQERQYEYEIIDKEQGHGLGITSLRE